MSAFENFEAECHAISKLLDGLPDSVFDTGTQFKSWTIRDIIAHLHLWNIAAHKSLTDPEAFQDIAQKAVSAFMSGQGHIEFQNNFFDDASGHEIYAQWQAYYPEMIAAFAKADPERRVKWVGPDMSAESCMIARHMEHWAHTQAVYDRLGIVREDSDGIKAIAELGVRTYSWSFKVRNLEPLQPKPYIRLTAPSGAIWEWNTPQGDNKIEGSATEFCQIVTQCRAFADTDLQAIGEIAQTWMSIAQCFAGSAEKPPAAGTRYTQTVS